jgi:helix-turn-helix protein
MICDPNIFSGAQSGPVWQANESSQELSPDENGQPAGESSASASGEFCAGSEFERLETDQPGMSTRAVSDGLNQAERGQAVPEAGAPGTAVADRGYTDADHQAASLRKAAIEAFRALRAGGATNKAAARKVGVPYMTLYWWTRAFDADGFEGLLPQTKNSGRKRELLDLTAAEVAAVRANKLLNNRDKNGGSTPLAIRETIAEGTLRPEMAAALLAREAAGKPMATPALANDLHIPEVFTRHFRNAREAWLEFNSSPGSLMMMRDEITGASRLIQPGECQTIDDGTKNFICTVPLERPDDKCWQKFKVVVGRWQILVHVDHRSYMILGINHTARPKGSYRAEDLQASLHIGFKQHGLPKRVFLERGISNADLLHHTLNLAGVKYQHVRSPHQKVVEFIFNALWSRLSFLPGQVGRTRGEEAEVDALVESCKRGARDPRDYFLPLATVLQELRKVCEEWNAHRVQSRNYGSWVPKDFFQAEAPKHMRELHPDQEWIFSPTVADNNGKGYLVRSQNITTSFPVHEGYSWVMDFNADWLCNYFGARVRLHYNAFEPECPAMAVLQENFHGQRKGTVLGLLEQINMHTRHSRGLFGIQEEEDIGLVRTRASAQALHRNVVGIRPDGKPGVAAHEARSGSGAVAKLSTADGARGATRPTGENILLAPAEPDVRVQRRERERLSRMANEALEGISD